MYSVTLYSICSVSWVRCTLRCTDTHTYTLCSLRNTLQSLAFFIHDYNIYWTWYRLQCCPSSQSWICSGDIVLTQERPTKSCMRIHVIMSCKHDIVCLYTIMCVCPIDLSCTVFLSCLVHNLVQSVHNLNGILIIIGSIPTVTSLHGESTRYCTISRQQFTDLSII